MPSSERQERQQTLASAYADSMSTLRATIPPFVVEKFSTCLVNNESEMNTRFSNVPTQ